LPDFGQARAFVTALVDRRWLPENEIAPQSVPQRSWTRTTAQRTEIRKQELKIKVLDGVLTIEGERKPEKRTCGPNHPRCPRLACVYKDAVYENGSSSRRAIVCYLTSSASIFD
jgi:hypothetical protein